jgi:hypothetical protein
VTTVSGFRTASVPLILIQLTATHSDAALADMIELAFRKNKLRMEAMAATLSRHPRAPGLARLHAALAAYRPRPLDKSGLERSIAERIAADPTIPPPRRNLHQDGWELDFYWEDEKVVLEADGTAYHKLPQDIERDKRKDMRLAAAAGIHVVRVTQDRWDLEPDRVMADLRALLGARRRWAA